jgi:GNAT superfamily N-acetyltransferase
MSIKEIKRVEKGCKEYHSLVEMMNKQWNNDVHIKEDLEDGDLHSIHVAIDSDNTVLGGTVMHFYETQHILFVSYVIVREELRGNGIGTKLMENCKDFAKNIFKDVPCYLCLYAERWNTASRRFYERLGFEYIYEEANVYPDGDGIACFYRLNHLQ